MMESSDCLLGEQLSLQKGITEDNDVQTPNIIYIKEEIIISDDSDYSDIEETSETCNRLQLISTETNESIGDSNKSDIDIQQLLYISDVEDNKASCSKNTLNKFNKYKFPRNSTSAKALVTAKSDLNYKNLEAYILICPVCKNLEEALSNKYQNTCQSCNVKLQLYSKVQADVERHERLHNSGISKVLRCKNKRCRSACFSNIQALEEHLKVCGKLGPYPCDFCPVRTHSKANLLRHLKAVHQKSRLPRKCANVDIVIDKLLRNDVELMKDAADRAMSQVGIEENTIYKIESEETDYIDIEPVENTNIVKVKANTVTASCLSDEYIDSFILQDKFLSAEKVINEVTSEDKKKMKTEYVLMCTECRHTQQPRLSRGKVCPCKAESSCSMIYKCLICLKRFNTLEEMDRHMQKNLANHCLLKRMKHHGYLKCSRCVSKYNSISKLREHEKVCGNPRRFICKICQLKTQVKSNLVRHLKEFHFNGKNPIAKIQHDMKRKRSREEKRKAIVVHTIEEANDVSMTSNLKYVKWYCAHCEEYFDGPGYEIEVAVKMCRKGRRRLNFCCILCKIKCRTFTDMERHLRSTWHNQVLKSQSVENEIEQEK